MSRWPVRTVGDSPDPAGSSGREEVNELLVRAARGDEGAFAQMYDLLSASVYGMARRVVRDPAMAEEVTQEVFLEVWRTATRYDPTRASAKTWMLTIAHRRAVDRVRSSQSSIDRERRVAATDNVREYDEVVEAVESRLEAQQVRNCMGTLTELQREAINLAYFGGNTYAQVATLLGTPLGTVKTRLRDGLIRLRDCLGVTA